MFVTDTGMVIGFFRGPLLRVSRRCGRRRRRGKRRRTTAWLNRIEFDAFGVALCGVVVILGRRVNGDDGGEAVKA